MAEMGHERVLFCSNPETGLQAIIAVHSTVLGPGLGGVPHVALQQHGGGAHRRPAPLARHDLQGRRRRPQPRRRQGGHHRRSQEGQERGAVPRASAATSSRLGGLYITAEDVGTDMDDMEVILAETRWVTGVSPLLGGGGDPSPGHRLRRAPGHEGRGPAGTSGTTLPRRPLRRHPGAGQRRLSPRAAT